MKTKSRAKRASETASKLQAIVEQLRELVDDLRDGTEPHFPEEIADAIEEHANELESIEFPTMFG